MDERAQQMNDFFGPLVPGRLGCVFTEATKDLVVGHIDVTKELIAGTGYLFAPAVIALADTLCAIGTPANAPEGTTFTTIELKTNFLGSAREGERVEGDRGKGVPACFGPAMGPGYYEDDQANAKLFTPDGLSQVSLNSLS